jgi:erythromycin esterase
MLPHHPLQTPTDLDPLLAAIGDARVVLLGEASHGTHEYYTWRTTISKRLIQEKGFQFIAVEGDWPACFTVNAALKQREPLAPGGAASLLKVFNRWPTWMWSNWEIVALVEWLHQHN